MNAYSLLMLETRTNEQLRTLLSHSYVTAGVKARATKVLRSRMHLHVVVDNTKQMEKDHA